MRWMERQSRRDAAREIESLQIDSTCAWVGLIVDHGTGVRVTAEAVEYARRPRCADPVAGPVEPGELGLTDGTTVVRESTLVETENSAWLMSGLRPATPGSATAFPWA